ncbi:cation diffusion facilitator family transporter [cf. Phormidesmis sp. LEGE 11477]|uniref:cation diffusion facilitator family transporter n=1 Tax=cf. Phormidesmis sp. LEGE 11477 TaxID=1828680 RepID=UPI00187E6FEA|nr:cation diffusion facilitator family transporter [cf. Phormidesmis sp. LEGE 11477]MBE9062786.1 cation diffusion facilitator family transporter [cf. Phormidesmis sp. LEGE 11477]
MNRGGYQRHISHRLLLMILWMALLVLTVELTVGWASKSLCLIAESLHTLVDVFSTLISLIAVTSPHRPLGKEIWGHGQSEATGALILSAILGFAGISILWIALAQIRIIFQPTPMALQPSVTLPLIFLVAVVVLLLLATVLFAVRHSQHNSSLAMKLNIAHILSDSWLTLLLLVGLFFVSQGYLWLDPMLAIFMVVLAVGSLGKMLKEQLPMLLKPTAIAPEAIAQIACQTEGVTRCTRILSRGMVGRQVWVELHITLHPEYMIIANSIGEKVERSLRDRYGPICAQIWLDQTKTAGIKPVQK